MKLLLLFLLGLCVGVARVLGFAVVVSDAWGET